MAQDNRPKQEGKTGFPGSFFLFLLVAVLIALTVQNFMTTKYAKVSFSYQVQHLMNLQLVVPQDNRMVALNDNLVTFSGRFRERLTDEGKKRFKYLQLLDKDNVLREQQTQLVDELARDRAAILSSADWFLHLTGQAISNGGYRVVGTTSGALTEGSPIVVSKLSDREVVGLAQIEQEIQRVKSSPTEAKVAEIGAQLSTLLQNFRSPVLGIGQDSLKQRLKAIDKTVLEVTGRKGGLAAQIAGYERVTADLDGVVQELNAPVDGVRLSQLRSTRAFGDALGEYDKTIVEIDSLENQLDKARESVSSVIWFFDNKELSTRALERQDNEALSQWFSQSKQEWDDFPVNKALPFKAVDQPRNFVLDRTFKSELPAPNYFSYLMPILLIGMVVMLLYFVFSRQMKGMGSGAMSFGKSPAKVFAKGMTNVTFKDVAGAEEAKEELMEIVDFLKNPGKYTALGGRIPKGVLCMGPPGTGKTLIAKAVAGEASRPFFSISGSDFVEMFVGVGASRIRDLFEQAKKNAPCIVFIDEIDAVGRHRGGGVGGGHDEREQTLNQLLVEMDGFDTNEGVIIIAATNRPDVLDKALLRPGRFDRRVMIDLPDVKGRFEILKVHAKRIKIDPEVDLMAIARSTPGSSGADLMNLLNEAALLAARKGRMAVTADETYEARDKVRYGKERRSLELTESDKLTTAYHESGHAIVGLLCKGADPVDKVTIIPRGMSLGATHFMPVKNRVNYWREELADHLAVAMGGRAAEEVFLGDVSSGASQDLKQATQMARSMVCDWGMSDEVGLVALGDRGEGGMMGMPSEKSYSEKTAQAIDEEVRRITDRAYDKAITLIRDHRDHIETMAKMLMEFETLDADDIGRIINGKWDEDDKRKKLKKMADLHKGATKEDQPPTRQEPGVGKEPLPKPAM